MDTPKPITTVLSMTTPQGNIIAQALHKNGPGGVAAGGQWPTNDDGKPCTWALQMGHDLWRTDQHLLLPEAVRGPLLPLHAQTVEEASEAVERAAYALEAFLQDFALLQRGLEHRVTKAQEYGKTPELPLGEELERCGVPYPARPEATSGMGCVKEPGHDGQHGYAGMFWDQS